MSMFEVLGVEPALIVVAFVIGIVLFLRAFFDRVTVAGTEVASSASLSYRSRLVLAAIGGTLVLVVVVGYVPLLTERRFRDAVDRTFLASKSDPDLLTSFAPSCELRLVKYAGGTYRLSWLVRSDPRLKPLAFINGSEVSLEGTANFDFTGPNFDRFALAAENAVGSCADSGVVFADRDAEQRFLEKIGSKTSGLD